MYYIMTCPYPADDEEPAALTYEPDHALRFWDSGMKFSTDVDAPPEKQEPATPIEITIEEDEEGSMKEMWEAPITVMTKRLAKALRDAGVGNIDEYEAVIKDTTTGIDHDDYVAFNIVGIVSAADLAQSEYDPSIRWFDKMVIDDSAPRDVLLFRLQEATYNIMVHERVKDHLQNDGFDSLEFIDPGNLTKRPE